METKKCVQCDKEFTITDSEMQFFENRNLNIPKRCKECREKNKTHQVKTNSYPTNMRKVKTFTIRKPYLIIAVLLLVSIIAFFKYEVSTDKSDGFHSTQGVNVSKPYNFRSESLLQEHFNKHGNDFGYESASQYENGANAVINSPSALHKTEVEDGDEVYYIKPTNELVILSSDGYIRTYFKPEEGMEYYNKQ